MDTIPKWIFNPCHSLIVIIDRYYILLISFYDIIFHRPTPPKREFYWITWPVLIKTWRQLESIDFRTFHFDGYPPPWRYLVTGTILRGNPFSFHNRESSTWYLSDSYTITLILVKATGRRKSSLSRLVDCLWEFLTEDSGPTHWCNDPVENKKNLYK